MAKGKERPTSPAKTAQSGGGRSPGSRPVDAPRDAPRPAKPDPNAPGGGGGRPFSGSARAELSPEAVYRLLQEAAFFKAKARDFAPGHEVQDWIEAEAEVRMRLAG